METGSNRSAESRRWRIRDPFFILAESWKKSTGLRQFDTWKFSRQYAVSQPAIKNLFGLDRHHQPWPSPPLLALMSTISFLITIILSSWYYHYQVHYKELTLIWEINNRNDEIHFCSTILCLYNSFNERVRRHQPTEVQSESESIWCRAKNLSTAPSMTTTVSTADSWSIKYCKLY
jgi:hypothetical protein